MSAPAYLNGPSIGVRSEDDISDATEFLNDSQVSEVAITGDEDLADQIESEIPEEMGASTITGRPARVASQLVALNIDLWNQTQEQNLKEFEQTIEENELEDELEELQSDGRQPATEEENTADNMTEQISDLLDEAEEALDDNDLVLAKAKLTEVRSEIEKSEFFNLSQEEIDEIVNEELVIPANQSNSTETQNTNETENESNTTVEDLSENQNNTENQSNSRNQTPDLNTSNP